MLKKGYKQTEIGVIPEDWKVSIFEDFADKTKRWSITGGPFGSNLKTDDYTTEGVQIVQLQNIGDGYFNNSSQIFTSNKKADELLSCNIYPGEIILSKMGDPVARACFIPNEFPRYLMASDGIRLVVNEKKYSKGFVFQYINSPFFRNRAIDISTGSTRQRIGLPELKSLKVILPPLTEQEAIASALSDADAWIDSLEQLIAKKRLVKQGAMQTLLTPKEDWEVKKLGEVFNITAGGDLSKYDWSDIKTDEFLFDVYSNSLTNKGLYCYSNSYSSEGNVITVTARGTVGYAVARFNKFLAIGRLLCLEPKFDLSIKYFEEYINNKISFANESTGVPQLTAPQIATYDISFPSLSEQERIATILSDMDAELAAFASQLGKGRQIKQGMMQELLTGRTRMV